MHTRVTCVWCECQAGMASFAMHYWSGRSDWRVLGVHMGEDGRARHLEVSTREDTTLEEVGGDVDVNGRALAQGASVVGFVVVFAYEFFDVFYI